jgi:hypothetical protein
METKILTADKQALLTRPLPAEAVTPHPTKTYLSSIKSIYVTERLNEVFGVGAWRVETNKVDQSNKMVVVKVRLTIPAYGIDYECYGGNDNADLGDAYKGATTDALTKIASWLGIGQEVFKGEVGKAHKPSPITTPKRKTITLDKLMDGDFADKLADWLIKRAANDNKSVESVLAEYYECDEEVTRNIISYIKTK